MIKFPRMESADPAQEEERGRLIAKLRNAVGWLFVPNLVAAFEYIKGWDSDEFTAWVVSRDFSAVLRKLRTLSDDSSVRDFVNADGSFDDARTVYEALCLVGCILDNPGYYGSDYRTLAAQVRFSGSIRDLCLASMSEWKKCP